MSQDIHENKTNLVANAHKSAIALFIRRPVFATVINILIVIAGLAAYMNVSIRELPNVDRAVISVSTIFSGAAAEVVDREITQKVEKAVSRVAGVKSISSSSSFGRSRVTLEFNDGIDVSEAASDIRDLVSRIVRNLPEDAEAPTIIKADADASSIMNLAVTSDSLSIEDLTILVDDQITGILSAVDGVADVQVNGGRDKIFRIEISLPKLSRFGLTIKDLEKALSNISMDDPLGSLKSSTQNITVNLVANVNKIKDFENLYINENVQLKNVAKILLSKDDEKSFVRINGKTAISLGIIRQASANTLSISENIYKAIDSLNENLGKTAHISVITNDAYFIDSAIHEVNIALLISIFSVILVIFLFLWDMRATLIPTISIPVAMIGTIAAIYLAGFSLNILTLLAFVLATGLVVDDAIVVLENIVRWRNMGYGVRAAAVLGTREVFFAVIATTLTLVAVFVPLSFLPGQAGGLFKEFGFVLAISILLSSFVSLTFCPMLASKFLKKTKTVKQNVRSQEDIYQGPQFLSSSGKIFQTFYAKTLHKTLDNPLITLIVVGIFLTISWFSFHNLQQELTPSEDRGQIYLSIQGQQAISVDYLNQQIKKIEKRLQPLFDKGEIVSHLVVAGMSSASNRGFMMLTLAPWSKRAHTQQQIVSKIKESIKDIVSVRVMIHGSNSLNIRGAGQGLHFSILGNSHKDLEEAGQKLLTLMQNDPEQRFQQPRLGTQSTQPQLFVHIDRRRAMDLNIDLTDLSKLLQSMLNGRKIANVFIKDRSFDVKLLSKPGTIRDPLDLENIFLKTLDSRYIPLSTIATIEEKAVPPQLDRESRMSAVGIFTNFSEKIALGDAYKAVQKLARDILPPGSYLIPLGEAATLKETSSGLVLVFGFAILVILLVLAAQFESFISAFIIMATIPLGLGCAVLALYFSGTTLNIYSQIGLVLLIGIMAKNGILIVEFADQLRERGREIRQAVEEASSVRLRPVMMTMICAILGGVPLVLAHGAGAEGRASLGFVIVGGLGLATIVTLYLTPFVYCYIARFIQPKDVEERLFDKEMNEAEKKSV